VKLEKLPGRKACSKACSAGLSFSFAGLRLSFIYADLDVSGLSLTQNYAIICYFAGRSVRQYTGQDLFMSGAAMRNMTV
jgi:hypothetical protein